MKRNGFTLIELLLVIAIIGLMAAIAVPRFSSPRTTGVAAKCKANIQTLEMALETYYSEYGRYPDPVTEGVAPLVSAGYLKLVPECQDEQGNTIGHYTWNADPSAQVGFTFADGTSTNLTNYTGGRVFCDVHGTLNPEDWRPEGTAPSGGGAGEGGGGG